MREGGGGAIFWLLVCLLGMQRGITGEISKVKIFYVEEDLDDNANVQTALLSQQLGDLIQRGNFLDTLNGMKMESKEAWANIVHRYKRQSKSFCK